MIRQQSIITITINFSDFKLSSLYYTLQFSISNTIYLLDTLCPWMDIMFICLDYQVFLTLIYTSGVVSCYAAWPIVFCYVLSYRDLLIRDACITGQF